MKIYIPSRGRHTQIAHGPLSQFNIQIFKNVVLVVPPDEVGAYHRYLYENNLPAKICDLRYDSIGHKRKLIGEMAKAAGEETFAMVDDDVVFSTRVSPESWNLRPSTSDDIQAMLFTMEEMLQECGSVGISAREGNNRAGAGLPLSPGMAPRNTRVMRVLAYRTEEFLACEHGRLRCMEDFDVQLQLLGRGVSNACLYYWANNQARTNAPGGCALWRTREVHNAAAEGLAALYPGIVRLRQKQNKTDSEGLGTRTEVTIAWKKAYEEGRRKNI